MFRCSSFRLFAVLGLGMLAFRTHAQTVTFTLNTTSPSFVGDYGYTASTPYTFSFTLGTAGSSSSASYSADGSRSWNRERNSSDPQLITPVSGSLIQGSAVSDGASTSIYVGNDGYFSFNIAERRDTGLTSPLGNRVTGLALYAYEFSPAINASYTDSYLTPFAFFSSWAGEGQTLQDATFEVSFGGSTYMFTAQSVDITVEGGGDPTPVPEPSTYAALAGVGALGFAAWRRRRARSATAEANGAVCAT